MLDKITTLLAVILLAALTCGVIGTAWDASVVHQDALIDQHKIGLKYGY